MRKFLAIILFCFTFAFAAENNKTQEEDIISITNQIQTLNSQIKILKAQQKDTNNSKADNSNLASLRKKKSDLLEKIPNYIMQIELTQSDINKFNLQKEMLEKKVARLEKQSNKDAYIRNAIELEKMKVDSAYYTALVSLEDIFKKGAKSNSIKEVIDNGLLNLQTNSYVSIKDLKDSLNDTSSSYDNAFFDLELKKETQEEILTYLKNNADLLSSNMFLSELNLVDAVEYINKITAINSSKFNIGKIVVIVAIFLFFVSLTRFLAKLTYWLMSLIASGEGVKEVKNQIVDIIKKPISVLLIIYALNICIGVGFYPVPVPIPVANIFSIIYIVAFSWLVLTILNGYGIAIIDKIAQKSKRKEVINLALKVIYVIVLIIALLLILQRLGFDISALIASLGIGGLAVAFAAKDIIANFFASVMMLFDNSFSQGDWIVCGDIEGTVVEIGFRKTTVRSFDNALIFVPNSKLASDPVRNWSRRKVGRRIRMVIGIEYGPTTQEIKKCVNDIKNMLINHPDIAKSEDIVANKRGLRYRQNIVSVDDYAGYKSNLFVVVDDFADSSINILVYCFAKTIVWGDFLDVKQDVMLKIMDILKQNGLNFAFPSQSLYIENIKDKI
nr:mechanosensitive ion channel domain-containing protein [uncultured Campylobacter sp.]